MQDFFTYVVLLSIGCILCTFAMFGISIKLETVALLSIIAICSVWCLETLNFDQNKNKDQEQ